MKCSCAPADSLREDAFHLAMNSSGVMTASWSASCPGGTLADSPTARYSLSEPMHASQGGRTMTYPAVGELRTEAGGVVH